MLVVQFGVGGWREVVRKLIPPDSADFTSTYKLIAMGIGEGEREREREREKVLMAASRLKYEPSVIMAGLLYKHLHQMSHSTLSVKINGS